MSNNENKILYKLTQIEKKLDLLLSISNIKHSESEIKLRNIKKTNIEKYIKSSQLKVYLEGKSINSDIELILYLYGRKKHLGLKYNDSSKANRYKKILFYYNDEWSDDFEILKIIINNIITIYQKYCNIKDDKYKNNTTLFINTQEHIQSMKKNKYHQLLYDKLKIKLHTFDF